MLLNRYRIAYEVVRGAPELLALHAQTLPQKLAYISTQNKLLAEKLYRKALTVDYVQERPSDQPRLHQVRLVVSTPVGRKPADDRLTQSFSAAMPTTTLTLNGGLSMSQPGIVDANSWQLRDAQLSGGFDWSPAAFGTLRPTYTVAYYFQYMIANAVLRFDGDAVTPGGTLIPLPRPARRFSTPRAPSRVQFRVSIRGTRSDLSRGNQLFERTELITGRPFWQGHAASATTSTA